MGCWLRPTSTGRAGRNLIRDAVTRLLDGSAGANAAAGSTGASFAPSP